MATQDICREFDWLSNLPESLLCSNILSRLPLTDAVRSSVLARKWRYLWTKTPHLHFSLDIFARMMFFGQFRRIQDTIEQMLIQHDAPLESFQFHLSMPIRNDAMDIHPCIQYAARKGVKRMLLHVEPSLRKKMFLPFSFISCTTIVDLELVSIVIPEIPPTLSENNFSFLRTCCLRNMGNLTDHTLHRLVEICPLLQELQLIRCRELIHLKIQARNLNYLILGGCSCVESLTADCPQLLHLRIRDRSSLAKLQLNSYNLVELKLRDCYKLSKLQLNSCVFLKEAGSLEGHSKVESLRKLSLTRCSTARSGLPCSTLFGTFPHLEELRVSSCMMGIALARGEEQVACQMEMVPDYIFPILKNAYLDISSDISEEDVAVLGFFLRNAPSLKTLTLSLLNFHENIDDQEFRNQVGGLERASAEAEIIWKKDDDEDVDENYLEDEDEYEIDIPEDVYEYYEDDDAYSEYYDDFEAEWKND